MTTETTASKIENCFQNDFIDAALLKEILLELSKKAAWGEKDAIILKLLDFAEHGAGCESGYAPDRGCTCGLDKIAGRCEELGYGG